MQNLVSTDQLSLFCRSRLGWSLSVSEKALQGQTERLQQRQEGLGLKGDESEAGKNATCSIPKPKGREGSAEEERAQSEVSAEADRTQTHPYIRAWLLRQHSGQEIR